MHRKDSSQVLKHKQVGFKAEKVADDGTFSGYGSIFGNVDSYGEIVAPGAFKESLKRIKDSGDPLPALWQHDSRQPIGGYDVLAEDDKGLKLEGSLLIEDLPMAKQAHALMKRRIVKGLSIGYFVEASSYNEKTGILTLQKLDLREISIVTFPANDLAQVESVKQLVFGGKMPTEREFEKALRDLGFSQSQAVAIASGGLKYAAQRDSAPAPNDGVIAALQGFKLPQF